MNRIATFLLLLLAVSLTRTAGAAGSLYKYRDANGNLVYTDRIPDGPAGTVESIPVNLENKAPRIAIQAISDGSKWELVATNQCLCVVEFEARILEARNLSLPAGAVYHRIVAPRSQETLVDVPHTAADGAPSAPLSWKGILGTPGVEHKPQMPYRAPFALGTSYQVSQAFPVRFTHQTPADQYAVDIALPDGTPVNAAREGTVINIRHDKYLGAATPLLRDQANMVEILHDDGTIAVYAHLHWDSVRVQPGQSVRRGEYIANSGNTGFTTGAHLHFAVIRNAGLSAESVPIQFAGPGGTAITPQTRMMLTAY
jgi:murein DD-endopeptidase MepM/ murein hydrolase activator NlpD